LSTAHLTFGLLAYTLELNYKLMDFFSVQREVTPLAGCQT